MGSVDQAQAFTTGDHANGYTLTSVEVEFDEVAAAATYSVGIWSSDEEVAPSGDTDTLHEPHTSLGTLTCPTLTVSSTDAVYECTTTGIDLAADTTYLFVVDSSSGSVNKLQNTNSNAEDTGGMSGWSIADNSIFRDRAQTGSWLTYANSKKIRINGTARTTPLDTTAPTVTSIERQDPSDSPTNADTLTWRVTFSEDVQNVNAADFSVSGTTATLAVAAVSGSESRYDVTASGGNLANLNDTVTLSFAMGQNITDKATHPERADQHHAPRNE